MNELKQIRNNLRITQVEAAKLLGISRRSYQSYEALSDPNNSKLKYYIYRLKELNQMDEEHGVLKLEEIRSILKKILSNYKVNFCYLFGSYAKNRAKPTSDIDLLIDANITGLDYFGLVEELRQALHKKIDLLNIQQLNDNQDLLREIMKDGIKIYG